MKGFGIFLIIIGLLIAYYAFSMDTSVSTDTSSTYGTDRVSNLGLMNFQQNVIISASALCIIGTILLVGGVIENKLGNLNISNLSPATQTRITPDNSDDSKLTPQQRDLKAKYERSEISLEDYKKEWNKLL